MLQFPQLTEEDLPALRGTLDELLAKSEASAVLLVERAGYLVLSAGDLKPFDSSQLATLAANAYAATEYIAGLVGEDRFNCMFQQGDKMSVLWRQIDETAIVVLVFRASVGVGIVRHYANTATASLASQFEQIRARSGGGGVDLSSLNPVDVSEVFRSAQKT